MSLTRRSVLRGSLVAALAAAAWRPGRARAGASPNKKVLEIFCCGGFFHWITARPDTLGGTPSWLSTTTPTGTTPSTDWPLIGGTDALRPAAVSATWPLQQGGLLLGEPTAPLVATGLHKQLRCVAFGHDLEAHEPAIVAAHTGSRLGRQRAASLGALLSHARAASTGQAGLRSIVLETAWGGTSYEARVATQVGTLGEEHRPVVVPLASSAEWSAFLALLERQGRGETDALKALYANAYTQSLTHPADARVRSSSFDAYQGAFGQLLDAHDLRTFLSQATPPPSNGSFTASSTRSAIHYAIDLLRAPSGDLRHACVLDRGVQAGYDTHDTTATVVTNAQGANMWAVMRALAEKHAAQPLTDIVVVIHSEFSRVEYNGDRTGTEHWAWGTMNLLLGGGLVGPALLGGYSLQGNQQLPYATSDWTPTDLRAAVAWAGGCADPFADSLDLDLATGVNALVATGLSPAAATEKLSRNLLGL